MNLKKNILYILVSTVLCLSIIAYPKSVYAYEDAWDELQQKVNESLGNYNQEYSDEDVYFKSTQSGAITIITLFPAALWACTIG